MLELLAFEYEVTGPRNERKNGNSSPRVIYVDVGAENPLRACSRTSRRRIETRRRLRKGNKPTRIWTLPSGSPRTRQCICAHVGEFPTCARGRFQPILTLGWRIAPTGQTGHVRQDRPRSAVFFYCPEILPETAKAASATPDARGSDRAVVARAS